MKVESQDEADELNETGEYGPYHAANGHLMMAELRFPRDDDGNERNYRVGDRIDYIQWSAWCADACDHDGLGPLPDY